MKEQHIQYLLNSYKKFVGVDLVERKGIKQDFQTVEEADFVVVSHGTENDPILNYGNSVALTLWEMSWEDFTKTPSHKTAEEDKRERRAEMLEEAREKGFIANYEGIRISSSGKRFFIKNVVVWRVLDNDENVIGQAATFKNWEFL
ncbi:MAG: MEKHLA domain-containing protein [Cytophagales bacterium]|nr:MEKHLA domain-containing protein [Cytophagales bacterium]